MEGYPPITSGTGWSRVRFRSQRSGGETSRGEGTHEKWKYGHHRGVWCDGVVEVKCVRSEMICCEQSRAIEQRVGSGSRWGLLCLLDCSQRGSSPAHHPPQLGLVPAFGGGAFGRAVLFLAVFGSDVLSVDFQLGLQLGQTFLVVKRGGQHRLSVAVPHDDLIAGVLMLQAVMVEVAELLLSQD